MNKTRRFASAGFTLLELLAVTVVILVLAALTIGLIRNALESSWEAKSSHQARQIVAALISDSSDRGTFYSKQEIGYSSFRTVEDPLGLPQLMQRSGYLKNTDVWWAPGARPDHKKFGNSYAWNRNDSVCGKSVVAMPDASSVALFWSNYSYTLPSANNVPEPTTGGPRQPAQNYWKYPYRGNRAANFAYADGHVGLVYRVERNTPTPMPSTSVSAQQNGGNNTGGGSSGGSSGSGNSGGSGSGGQSGSSTDAATTPAPSL